MTRSPAPEGAKKLDGAKKGLLIVLVGPTNTGKTTFAAKMVEGKHAVRQITCTTRQPRHGEKHGEDYFFATREDFAELQKAGALLEWAEVHDNLYGTPKSELLAKLQRGQTVVIAIDIKGLRQVKEHRDLLQHADVFSVFIYAREETIRRRFVDRAKVGGQPIDLADLEKRLATAREELRCISECDQTVPNDQDGEVQLNSAFMRLLGKIDARRRLLQPAVVGPWRQPAGIPRPVHAE